jgi:hypothetical protein
VKSVRDAPGLKCQECPRLFIPLKYAIFEPKTRLGQQLCKPGDFEETPVAKINLDDPPA